jgi:hypothetical protein
MFIIYLITLPIILYITYSITFANKWIQAKKEKHNLHLINKKGFRYLLSKVLNCSFCLAGHLSYLIFLFTFTINPFNIFLLIVLTYCNMNIAKTLEENLYNIIN